jgi:CBS domain-containing protein
MHARQIMTRQVITVTADAAIVDAAHKMLQNHISGLPVVNEVGNLIGIVSEGDFMRRGEIGTQKKRGRWLKLLVSPGKTATDFVHEQGRKVGEIMTPDPCTITEDTTLEDIVQLMEKNDIKRLPVLRGSEIVGIVTRSNLMQAVSGLARDIPDPTADDNHIRDRIILSIEKNDWRPLRLGVNVRNGIVHLNGVITDERSRQAIVVAAENVSGAKQVHDHLCWVDTISGSGIYIDSPEDHEMAKFTRSGSALR